MKLGYRPKEAAEVLGSEQLLDECVAGGWLKPRVQRPKLTLYDYSEIAKCWARICAGEMPPRLVRNPICPSTRKPSADGVRRNGSGHPPTDVRGETLRQEATHA